MSSVSDVVETTTKEACEKKKKRKDFVNGDEIVSNPRNREEYNVENNAHHATAAAVFGPGLRPGLGPGLRPGLGPGRGGLEDVRLHPAALREAGQLLWRPAGRRSQQR